MLATRLYNMADLMAKDDDLDAAFVCTTPVGWGLRTPNLGEEEAVGGRGISATTLLNLNAELSECCTKRKQSMGDFAYRIAVPHARLFAIGVY